MGRDCEHRFPLSTALSDDALLRRRLLFDALEREHAGDGCSTADGRIEPHGTTMQLDEGTHDRQSETRAAVAGTKPVALEAVEHALADRRRNAGAGIGHAEHHGPVAPF